MTGGSRGQAFPPGGHRWKGSVRLPAGGVVTVIRGNGSMQTYPPHNRPCR